MPRPERRAQSPLIPQEIVSVCPRCGSEIPRYTHCTSCSYQGNNTHEH